MFKALNTLLRKHHETLRPSRLVQKKSRTADGRRILGFWGWFERIVLVATFISIILTSLVLLRDEGLRREELVERAFEIISSNRFSDELRRRHLERLSRLTGDVRRVDLSCELEELEWNVHEPPTCPDGVDLSYMRLGRDNAEFDLSGANFSGAILDYADFGGANLRGAKFRGASLYHTVFEPGFDRFWNVDFSHADITGVNFSNFDIIPGNFSGARITSGYTRNITGATLPEFVSFFNANLFKSNFDASVISGVSFEGTHLANVVFRNASFDRVDFTNSTLHSTDFTNATGLSQDMFTGAWAWSHVPPIGLVGINVLICNSSESAAVLNGRPLRLRDRRPESC